MESGHQKEFRNYGFLAFPLVKDGATPLAMVGYSNVGNTNKLVEIKSVR